MSVFVFWLQAFWKTVLWPFFHWNLRGFLNEELVFKERSTFFGAHHCVFIRNSSFLRRSDLIFRGAPGFFVIRDRFLLTIL